MKKQKNELVDAIVAGLQEKKGRDIVVCDLTDIPDAICHYFVICSGGSPLQVQALAHSVGETCREKVATKPLAVDGLGNAVWVAMDFAEVIVHIFVPELRTFYDIEHLWADADLRNIPNID
ncbi:MAG: ribosome silencing factor [Bacteroidaceae bacterium]|nr:ribosome silencing factor [Bacteroidaceae bacterium]